MGKKKKLKLGDIVRAYFVGSPSQYQVIEVIDKLTYKLKEVFSGTILPKVKWKKDMDKKSPWYIESYIGTKEMPKSTKDQNTIKNTTEKDELKKAIEKQKKFTKGNIER